MLSATRCSLLVRRCAPLLNGYKAAVKDIQELRFRTEAPMTDCKKALEETAGDFEKAIEWLRQKGKSVAEKKQGRVTDQGMLAACCGPHGALALQVCCETDFSGRNERFLGLCDAIRIKANTVIDGSQGALLKASSDEIVAELSRTVKDDIETVISVIKENITIKRAFTLPVPPAEAIATDARPVVKTVFGRYVHNSLFNFGDVGQIVGIVGLRVHSDQSPLLVAETANEIGDLAQHMVANMANTQGLTHQPFLGSEETAGQWMKKRSSSLNSGLVVKFGEEPVVHIPVVRPPNPKQQQQK